MRCVVLFLLAATAVAQGIERATETVVVPITAVTEGDSRMREVLIDRGSADGVVLGWRGKAISIRETTDETGHDLGVAEITAVATHVARARVTLNDPRGDGLVRKGDGIELRMRVATKKERSILWTLALRNIGFRRAGANDILTDFRTLQLAEKPELVEAILDRMVATIRDTGSRFASMDVLKKPIAGGRYKGRKPGDIMIGATRRELDDFLKYVETYERSYVGRTWRIDETFATWVIADAPYSSLELIDLLLEAPTPEGRDALLADFTEGRLGLGEYLLVRSNALSNERRFDKARLCISIAAELARELKSARLRAWCEFSEAHVLSEEQKRDESIAAYQKAAAAFRALAQDDEDNRKGLASSLRNMGLEYEHAGRLPAALKTLRDSLAARRDDFERVRVMSDIGRILRDQARHTEAIEVYERAAAICRERDALHVLSDVLAGKAKSLAKLGRNKEAAKVYEEVRKENVRIGERAAEASTLADIGSQRWSLGNYAAALAAYEQALRIRRDLGDKDKIGNVLQSMGRLKVNLGQFDEARALYEEARDVLSDRSDKAILLTDLGELEVVRGNFEEALRIFGSALRIQREIANRTGEAYVHRELGDLRVQRHEYEQARAEFDEAARIYREAEANGSLASVLRDRASVNHTLKEYDRSLEDYGEALRISRETGERAQEAENLNGLGWIHWSRREFPRARKYTNEALAIARESSNKLLEGQCLRRLGRIWTSEYRIEEALQAFRAALDRFEDPGEIAGTRIDIANELGNLGRFDEKLAELRAALELAREANATQIEQNAILGIGATLHTLGDLDGALVEYENARGIEVRNEWSTADMLASLAGIYSDLGRGADAIAFARQALDIYGKLRNDWGRARTLNLLAILHRRNGELERARVAIEKALPLGAATGTAVALNATCGEVLLDLGEVEVALRHFEVALAEARRLEAPWSVAETLLYTARARRRLGRLDEAQSALTDSLAYFDKVGAKVFVGDVLQQQAAVALARGKPAAARTAMVRALALAQQTGSPHLLWKAHQRMSRAEEALGDLDAAVAERRKAIAALDRIRSGVGNDPRAQQEFLRSRIDVYESMAELLGRLIDKASDKAERQALIKESFEFISRARFQILSRDMEGVGGTGVKAVDDLLRKIERAKADIARLEKKLQKAHADGNRKLAAELTKVLATNVAKLDELHTNLAAADPDDFGARVKFEPSSLDEDVASLPEHARLVVYFVGIRNLFIWVYGRDGIVTWKQHTISREEINAKVGRFRKLIDEAVRKSGKAKGRGFGPEAEANEKNPEWYRRNCKAMREVLTELHTALIAPIADEIAEAQPLLVMPYGWLNYLPFEALMDKDGRFLGESREIAYFLHHKHLDRSLRRLSREPHRGKDVWVAFVDPVGKLPSALEEAAEIEGLFPNRSVHTQQSKTATEAHLFEELREDCTILHFATHGYLKGKTPSDTYIELGPGGDYDGNLRQSEVFAHFKQKLACIKAHRLRLVVLSACETARAQDEPAAEILGMPDKFTKVGAPAVIASLWSVYTYSTSALMVGFYERLAKGEAIGAALQSARIELFKDRANGRYAHPFYWSPFLLFGDWR